MHTKPVASAHEPLCSLQPLSGATIEVFYADQVFKSMRAEGWFWWSYTPGDIPEWPPNGPHATSCDAFRDASARQSGASLDKDDSKPPLTPHASIFWNLFGTFLGAAFQRPD
jgi:hypothetical protein